MTFSQPCVSKNFQVPAYSWLALAKNSGDFTDREFALHQERDNAQTAFLTDRAKMLNVNQGSWVTHYLKYI